MLSRLEVKDEEKGEEVSGRERQVLELYQKALSKAKQLLAAAEVKVAEKDSSTGEVAVRLGGEVANAVNRNPVDILVPEMWTTVFKHLEDWRDLKSCYDTCQLFRDLLENTKNEWLFPGVLPLILRDLPVLKCRQVCKAWKQEVDRDDTSPKLGHIFYFELSETGRARTRQKIEEMINHGRNPFIGTAVVINTVFDRLLRTNWLDEQEQLRQRRAVQNGEEENGGAGGMLQDPENNWRIVDQERVLAALVQDFQYFLNGLGKFIKSILFMVNDHTSRPSVLFYMILGMVSKCHSLKNLAISGFSGFFRHDGNGRRALDPLSDSEWDALVPEDCKVAPNFQSLTVFYSLPGFLPIEHRLLRLSASTLKEVRTVEWTSLNFEMEALEELIITPDYESMDQPDQLRIHQDLMQLRAPNLKKLSFYVNTSCTLQNLLTLTSRFPNLQHLILNWTEEFVGFAIDELLDIPDGVQPPEGLKTLQFDLSEGMNFDFLICFPLIETLRMCPGFSEDENENTGAVVQVSDYWMEESKVYESNVWELLPFLQTVMVYDLCDFEEESPEEFVYTREKYNASESKGKSAK